MDIEKIVELDLGFAVGLDSSVHLKLQISLATGWFFCASC